MQEQLSELQKELRRNRLQSYIFLILMFAGVIYSFYLYQDLQDKKEQIATNYQELKESKAKLALKDSLLQRQKVMNEVIAELKVLVDDESDDAPNDKEAILRKLQQKAQAENQLIESYHERRGELIAKLFSKNESVRTGARDELLRKYVNDEQLLPEILAFSQGKVNQEYQESVWQLIYIFDQLDGDMLKPESDGLNDFFATATGAGLVGERTSKTINSIKNRM